MTTPTIAFIGAGNMASAMIGGMLADGIPADHIRASSPSEEGRAQCRERFGIEVFEDNVKALKGADVVILAVKPQIMKEVCQALADSLSGNPLIITVAAGLPASRYESWLGSERPLVRCMPNTPSMLGLGASGLYANGNVTAEQRQIAERLIASIGLVHWVDEERLIDAVTAVSGSGPAYVFLLIEAMADAGEKLGLDRAKAEELAAQTALGAASMVLKGDVDAAEQRRRVCSPQGTTEAAIRTFQSDGFEALVEKAMRAAADRSAEMSEQMGR